MNLKQKKLIKILASVIGLMLLIPPYKVYGIGVNARAVMDTGYSFIFELPIRASIDGLTLIIQWIGVCLIGALIYKLLDGD